MQDQALQDSRLPLQTRVTVGGFLIAGLLAAGIVGLSPSLTLGLVLGALGLLLFLVKPVETLLTAIVFRVFMDILWWVPFEVAGLNVSQIFSVGVFAMLVLVVLLKLPRLHEHPGAFWALGSLFMMGIATLRAIDLRTDLDILFRYPTSPLMFLATALVFDTPRLRRLLVLLITCSALVPLAWSMFDLITGASDYVLHGYDRLLGGYKNIHNHALVMMVFAMLFLTYSGVVKRRALRWGLWGLTGACMVAIYFTYTRTGMLGVALSILAFLLALRQRQLVALALVGGAFLMVLDPDMQERFGDLLGLFDTSMDSSERRELGSGRWGLWSWSMNEYLSRPVSDIVIGIGLGGFRVTTEDWSRAFHRMGLTLDPHNDYLLFLYQMGPMGVITYVGMLWATYKGALLVLRHPADPWARLFAASVIGLCVGVFITNGVSNSFIHRSAPGWYFWARAGVVVGESMEVRARLKAAAREAARPKLISASPANADPRA